MSASESAALGSADMNGSQAAAKRQTQLAKQPRGDGRDTVAVSTIVLGASALHHEGPGRRTTSLQNDVQASRLKCFAATFPFHGPPGSRNHGVAWTYGITSTLERRHIVR